MWKKGAIIEDVHSSGGYLPVEDVWNVTPKQEEYISRGIIEHPDNARYFERVYRDNFSGTIYRTAEQLRDIYDSALKSV